MKLLNKTSKLILSLLVLIITLNIYIINSFAATDAFYTLDLTEADGKLIADFKIPDGEIISWRWGKEAAYNNVSYNQRLSETNTLDIANLTGDTVTLTITYGVKVNDKYGARIDRRTYRENIKVNSGVKVSNIYSSAEEYKKELDRLKTINSPSQETIARITELEMILNSLKSGSKDILKVDVSGIPTLRFCECRWYMREAPDEPWGAITGKSSLEHKINTDIKGREYMFRIMDGSKDKVILSQSDIYKVN